MDISADTDGAVVGFDFSGDDMLRGDLLSFQQGLTVLYGLNGTGKSRLLRGVRGALLGVQTDVKVSLIVRATVSAAVQQFSLRSGFPGRAAERPVALALAQELADPSDYWASPGQRSSERELPVETVERVIVKYIEDRVGAGDLELRAEVLEDRWFLLAPTGTEGAPSWSAYAVADASRPGAVSALARVADLDDTYPEEAEDTDAYDEAFDAYVERVRAVPVLQEVAQFFWVHEPHTAVFRPFSVALYAVGLDSFELEGGISIVGPIDFGLDVLDLERNAGEATQDYFSRLVAGALQGPGRGEIAPFDGTFPVSQPERLDRLWQRVDQEQRNQAATLIEQTMVAAAAQLSELVTEVLGDVLLDPLVASLELAPSALRAAVPPLEWRFHRVSHDEVRIGIDSLSRAERLWSERAINEAVYWHQRDHGERLGASPRPVIYLLDEPESALHRAAEAFMAKSLLRRARDTRRALVVATHSPELLDTTEARLVELRRARTRHDFTVRPLNLADRGRLAELGLVPSDFLRWPRVLLLVEGLHDEALLDHWLGDRLRAARVDVLVLRGGTKLPLTVDSKVLFEHTEAHVVGLVDNENATALRETWEKAQIAAAQGDAQDAINIVLEGIPRTRSESDFLREWLTGALKHGLDGRVTPYALELADIIEYLPVDAFIPGAASWDALKLEHRTAREASKKTVREFKPWLRATYGVDFAETSLRDAATRVPVPTEFEQLMKTLEAISAQRG